MNESSGNESTKAAKERLLQACRTKDKSKRLGWTVSIGAAVLILLLVLTLLDYWLILSIPLRTINAGLVLILAAFGVHRFALFLRKPTQLKEAALDAESQRPELGCEISTAAEYISGERKVSHEYEPQLVAALEAKAAENLRAATPAYNGGLLMPLWIFAGVLICLILFVALAPVGSLALTRTALPFLDTHYTHVTVAPGNIEIPVGRDLDVTNFFSGRIPKNPQFHWQEAGSPQWQTVPLSRSTDGSYVHSFKSLRTDLRYQVTGGDAVSSTYQVQTYVPPEVKGFRIEVSPPAYVQQPPRITHAPDITALRASTANVQISASSKLSKATLHFPQGPGIELVAQPGDLWAAQIDLNKETDYWIELIDDRGHAGVAEKPYHIRLLRDRPPKVEITEPGHDLRAAATNTIPIKISAADDFGVDEIRLLYHLLKGAPMSLTATRNGQTNGEITASANLSLESLNLKEFDVIAYQAEVKDNNTLDGPGVGRSSVYFIEIGSREGTNSQPMPVPAQGENVNLLDIQKQIIAETSALATNTPNEAFVALASQERKATEYGRIYLDAMTKSAAPPEAITEMQAAIKDLEHATSKLGERKAEEALPGEESALAHFFQVLKQLPELQNLPVDLKLAKQKPPSTNDVLSVALAGITKKRPQEKQPDRKELEEALRKAKELNGAQKDINAALAKANQNGQGQGKGEGDGQGQGQDQGQPTPGDQAQAKNDQPKKDAQEQTKSRPKEQTLASNNKADAKGAQGKGQKPGNGQPQDPNGEDQKKDPANPDDPAAKEQLMAKNSNGQPKKEQGQGEKPDQADQDPSQDQDKPGQQDQAKDQDDQQSQELMDAQNNSGLAKQGKGKGNKQAKSQAKGKGKGKGKARGPKPQNNPANMDEKPADQPQQEEPSTEQLAEKQEELSKEAEALAENLQQLEQKNPQTGQHAGQNAGQAANNMVKASQELRKGNLGSAGVNGFQGEAELDKVVSQLERALKEKVVKADVTSEEAPKAYETLISEYLKKLSHAE